MSILLIGGHDRMHDQYKKICAQRGHKVKVYTHMPPQFDKVIGNPDGIILLTATASHKMVRTAVKEAKRKSIPVLRCHNSGGSSLDGILEQLEEVLV